MINQLTNFIRCSAYVRARKQLSVHEVPNILTIVLKRFQVRIYLYYAYSASNLHEMNFHVH